MSYNLEQLRVFVEVCASGSFSAAARRLRRAQSGISQAIAHLEIAWDRKLFERHKSGLHLTEDGEVLLKEARAVLAQAHQLDLRLQAMDRKEEMRLVVAMEESLWSRELMQSLQGLAVHFPFTQFEFMSAATFDVEQMVAEGAVHFGVVYQDYDMGKVLDKDYYFLGMYPFVTVVAPQHPLAALEVVRASDLMAHLHLVHRSLNGKELWFADSSGEACWYSNDHYTLREWALLGMGWTDLPLKMVARDLELGRLKRLFLDFEPEGNVLRVVALRSRAYWQGKVGDAFLKGLRAFLRQ